MSALDFTARALAQRVRGALPELFTALSGRAIPTGVDRVESTGHTLPGKGAATYVCDALCDEALLADHPAFSFKSADGRIFRLAGESVCVEQGGAMGDPDNTGTINDQPAIQATLDYAAAVGIREVVLTQRRYNLFATIRTTPADNAHARDGHSIVITHGMTLRGTQKTDLHYFGPGGEPLETNWQLVHKTAASTTDDAVWRGWGIMILGDTGDWPANLDDLTINEVRIENIRLRGGQEKTAARGQLPADVTTGDGWDVSAKGIGLWNVKVDRVHLRNVEVVGFKGELLYIGGVGPNYLRVENCHFHRTNADAFNPGGSGETDVVASRFGDAHAAVESFGRNRFMDCRFYDCDTFTLNAWPDQGNLYSPILSRRNADGTAPANRLDNCEFERVRTIYLTSWVRAKIKTVDCKVMLASSLAYNLQDVDLDLEAWLDQAPTDIPAWVNQSPLNEPVVIAGPSSLTSGVPGAPAGTYIQPPSNLHIRLRCYRSKEAAANGLQWLRPVNYYGYIDQDTVVFEVPDMEAASLPVNAGTAYSMPLFLLGRFRSSQPSSANPAMFGGATHNTTTKGPVLTAFTPVIALRKLDTSVESCSLASPFTAPYGYADGQTLRIVHDATDDVHQFTFAASGAGMRLAANRTLSRRGDYIDLVYSTRLGTWLETAFLTGRATVLEGSASIDIPLIAAGGSWTGQVTVTGAVAGDIAAASINPPQPGLIVTTQASAADQLSVTLFNAGAGDVTPGQTAITARIWRS